MNIKHIDCWATGYCKSHKGKQLQAKRKSGSKMRRKVYLNLLKSGMHQFTEDNIQRVRRLHSRKIKCPESDIPKAQAITEIKNGNYL